MTGVDALTEGDVATLVPPVDVAFEPFVEREAVAPKAAECFPRVAPDDLPADARTGHGIARVTVDPATARELGGVDADKGSALAKIACLGTPERRERTARVLLDVDKALAEFRLRMPAALRARLGVLTNERVRLALRSDAELKARRKNTSPDGEPHAGLELRGEAQVPEAMPELARPLVGVEEAPRCCS